MHITIDNDALRRPIGYWLKHLDRRFEEVFSQLLATQRLTRRHWQTLNTLAGGAATPDTLAAALAPFLADDPDRLATVSGDLISRGWARRDDGLLALTDVGLAAHRYVQQQVEAFREQLLDGIGPDEYAATVTVLARMAGNLDNRTGR